MSNYTKVIFIVIVLIIAIVANRIAAKIIRKKRAKLATAKIVTEPTIFEKITLQFSDKISKELEAAENKIRNVVGSEEKENTEREQGMFL